MSPLRSRLVSSAQNPPASLDLDALYRAHAATVARWVAHLGGPWVDVDALVHEIFLVAGRRLPEFRGDAKVTTWLFRIMERVVRDGRRRELMRRRVGRARRGEIEQALAPSHLSPVEDLERRQARETVHRILDGLADKYRSVLVLFELEGLPGEEIAALTGLKLPTVWVRLHRARSLFLAAMNSDEKDQR